jgi:LacI family transcriptional regulator
MGSRPPKATIDDVANLAGVSVSTVSRVLNNEKYVREAMREKVMHAVKVLRYKPNMHARGLAGEKSHVFGLFFDDPRGDYVSSILYGALKKCDEQDIHLVVEILGQDKASDKIESFLTQLRPDGVILPPPICDNLAVLETLEKQGIPVVRIAPSTHIPSMASVKIDDHAAAYEVAEYIINQGHTDIAIIKGDPEHGGAGERLNGFLSAIKANSIEIGPENIEQGYFSFESGFECAERLFARDDLPTVIFACNDEMASAVISCAAQKGIKIPEDVSVVGFDDAVIASRIWPTLTTVRQPAEEIAIAAVEYLKNIQIDADTDDEGAQPVIVLKHNFVERNSCVAANP